MSSDKTEYSETEAAQELFTPTTRVCEIMRTYIFRLGDRLGGMHSSHFADHDRFCPGQPKQVFGIGDLYAPIVPRAFMGFRLLHNKYSLFRKEQQ